VNVQVHFLRSVQRIAKKFSGSEADEKLFVDIGRRILKTKSQDHVLKYFEVMRGTRPLADADVEQALDSRTDWRLAEKWVDWFLQDRVLGEGEFYFHKLRKKKKKKKKECCDLISSARWKMSK